jgi:guanylate kinase
MSNFPLITISSPSGGGKSTITQKILKSSRRFAKSISATTRSPRITEIDGRDYYFLSIEEFKAKITNNEFLEWEEVYQGVFYGTLNSEIQRIVQNSKIPILTIDINGALELKKKLNNNLLTIFLDVPNIEILENRLKYRATETATELQKRLDRAKYELSFKNKFDVIIPNLEIRETVSKVIACIDDFLHKLSL